MLFRCRKNIENKNPKIIKTEIGRITLLSKWEVSDSKNSKFIKEREASIVLSSLGTKTLSGKILY